MARVLFGVAPAIGHINPTIAIAQRLQSEGHTVAYACHPEMASVLESAGLELLYGFRWGDRIVEFLKALGTQPHQWMAIVRSARGRPISVWFKGLDEGIA